MSIKYDEAVTALYRAPHEAFVGERQRLAAELKAGGDAAAGARLAKLARPPISAWAVNQLWWREHDAFQELFETAALLRVGKLAASSAHRQAIAKLGAHARKILLESGHSANEGTLRRVESTLAGLAAAGGFEPEPAGALSKDREPPGFDAFSAASLSGVRDPAPKPAQAQNAREEANAERKRVAEERARKQAERRELEAALSKAQDEHLTRRRARERLAQELARAESDEERARATVEQAEARLASVKKES
ncbi:MAG TPA: hypothetical protein VGI10_17825 [Polyangiaceae bacterium]|jgi:hypothetical protein